MKIKRAITTFLASQFIAIFVITGAVGAQTNVAIVDIGTVFKSHTTFTKELDDLRKEAELFKANALQLQQQLVQKAEGLKQFNPGSQEFKKAESELAKESAGLEVEQRNRMRTLMQQEAQLHFDTYSDVKKLVEVWCDARGIELVLRFNSQPMDSKNPATIMQRVNGSVIFYDQRQDITQAIVSQLGNIDRSANAGGEERR